MSEHRPRIALTGGTGFIGRAVLAQLRQRGLAVRALARRPEASANDDQLEWHVGDIRDRDIWDRLLPGCNSIVHLASAGVADLRDIAQNVETNLPAFAALMRAASRHGVRRVVLAGSCFEYGRTGERIGDRGLLGTDALCPTNVYAATKAGIAMLAGPLADELRVDTVVLRPFHVYGPTEPMVRLIPSVLEMIRAGGNISITSGRQVRDFVYLDDVASAFVAAVVAPKIGDERMLAINIGTGVATPLAAVVRRLAELCGADPERIRLGAVAHRDNEMWRLVADPAEARELLGWSSRVDLEEGLRRVVAGAMA